MKSPSIHSSRRLPLAAWLALALLIFAAFAIRIHRLDAVSLRGDEAYSVVHWTATPFSDGWKQLWRNEPAPVGAFTMYWAWNGLAGKSVFATRYLSLLGNVAGLAVILALAKRLLKDWRLAALAGIVWAVHPFLIWHAQDARVYGVLSMLTPLSFYWLYRLTQLPDDRQNLRAWSPYIFVQTAAIYIYYLEPFWLLAQGIFVLALRRRAVNKSAFRAWVVVGILSAPVMAQLYTLMFVSEYHGNAESGSLSLLLTEFVPTLLFGDNTVALWLGGLIVLALLGGLALVYRRNPKSAILLGLWLFVPVLTLYVASYFADFFRPRYVVTVVPALIIALVAIGAEIGYVVSAYRPRLTLIRPLTTAAIFTVVIAGYSLVEVNDYFYHDLPKAPDWNGLTRYIEARADEHTAAISGSADPALDYYFEDVVRILFIPIDNPDPALYMPDVLNEYPVIYLLQDPNSGAVENYLRLNAQYIPGDVYPGVRQYRKRLPSTDEIQNPTEITVGDVAILRGYTPVADTSVILYWSPLATIDQDYTTLIHLVRQSDGLLVTLDHPLGSVDAPASMWETDSLYRDPVAIPADFPPGSYTISANLQNAAGEPLPVENDPSAVTISIGIIVNE